MQSGGSRRIVCRCGTLRPYVGGRWQGIVDVVRRRDRCLTMQIGFGPCVAARTVAPRTDDGGWFPRRIYAEGQQTMVAQVEAPHLSDACVRTDGSRCSSV